MKHYCDEWIEEWCQTQGWTDVYVEKQDNYWAFPPGAVMPQPIPPKVLRLIKQEKGLCPQERFWSTAAMGVTLIATLASYFFTSPLPLVFAFGFTAITVAQLEVETL